jgi:molecular chaperone GrpE
LKNFWNRKGKKVPDQDTKDTNMNVEPPEPNSGGDQPEPVNDEVTKLAADLEDLRQTLLRRQADFENYRKRIEKERADDTKRATARLVEGLIPIIDGFEQALAAHREKEYENYRKGFELIYKQLLDNVAKLGVERVDPIGMHFDPHKHQAMERTETTDREDGIIVQTFQPGYVYHGRVLRPAMVRVAVNPAAASKNAVN